MAGVFITFKVYSFRMYFLVFHGEERFGKAHAAHEHAPVKPAARTIVAMRTPTITRRTRMTRTRNIMVWPLGRSRTRHRGW